MLRNSIFFLLFLKFCKQKKDKLKKKRKLTILLEEIKKILFHQMDDLVHDEIGKSTIEYYIKVRFGKRTEIQ